MGRLVELTVVYPVTVAEVQACATRVAALMTQIKGRVVIVGDIRNSPALHPDVAEAFGKLMRADNPRIERSALLVGEGAVLGLQVERMVREAKNPMRRMFRSAAAALTWLGEVTTVEERARLVEMLG